MSYLAKEKGAEPVMVPELGRDISLAKDIKAFFGLYSIIRRERPDIVHTHTAKAGALGRLAAILSGVPVKIHTFHGHVFDGYFDPFKARIFVLIEKFLGLFTDKVITVSSGVKADIIDRLGVVSDSKSAVIPLGFELERFLYCGNRHGEFRRRLGLSEGTLLIGIVGRLVPIKNHLMFLDSAKEMLNKRPKADVRFIIIGNGESEKYVKEYSVKIGISGHVIFTGWIEDLVPVYADLDVVALTSLNEGTPVSIIEAMASARPVVATAVGGVMDLINDGENGFLVDTGDSAKFADRLITLMDDRSLRSNMGANGRRSVSAVYSKTRLLSDIKKLYQECLSEKGIAGGRANR